MDWGTSDVVAAVMAVVAFGAVFVTGIQIVVSGKQADKQRTHEESMHEQRLTHERRVAHEAAAAEAYQKADKARGVMAWELFDNSVRHHPDALAETGRMMRQAIGAMTQAKFYAWSDPMAEACSAVITSAEALERKASASRDRLRSWLDQAQEAEHYGGASPDMETFGRIEEKYRETWQAYGDAVEGYRVAARIGADD